MMCLIIRIRANEITKRFVYLIFINTLFDVSDIHVSHSQGMYIKQTNTSHRDKI